MEWYQWIGMILLAYGFGAPFALRYMAKDFIRETINEGRSITREGAIIEMLPLLPLYPAVVPVNLVLNWIRDSIPETESETRDRLADAERKIRDLEHAAGTGDHGPDCLTCHPKPVDDIPVYVDFGNRAYPSGKTNRVPYGRCGRPSSACSITTCGCVDYRAY